MLLKQTTLAGIQDGRISLAFRRWLRPTVKPGGTLLTSIGQLAIEAVEPIEEASITDEDAERAGFSDRGALLALLNKKKEGELYRIRLALAGPDPRIALRNSVPSASELAELATRLARIDARSKTGRWTASVLRIIAEHPAVRAGDLADRVPMERADFKVRVRKLKSLGLTESLKVGYRLSARGEAVVRKVGDDRS